LEYEVTVTEVDEHLDALTHSGEVEEGDVNLAV
jgi:hypothetical protein